MRSGLASLWRYVRRSLGLPSRASRPTGTAVAAFVPSKEAKALQISNALRTRDSRTTGFIEAARFGYVQLRPDLDIDMLSQRVKSDNFVRDQARFRELEDLSSHYFRFTTELFKFHGRKDRTAWDLLRRPQTYADLEEENIEEKFPEDVASRALICALDRVIAHNRWHHILRKRVHQVILSLPLVALLLLWPRLSVASDIAAHFEESVLALTPAWRSFLEGAVLAALASALAVASNLVLRHQLAHGTHEFEQVNVSSCQILSRHMTSVNSDVRGLFNKLIANITSSEKNLEDVSSPDWAEKIRRAFKVALWEAKRMEYLERFWQLRLERLRLFEVVGNEIGNMLSRVVAIVILGVSLWLAPHVWHPVTIVVAVAIWYLGWTTRRPGYGFDMSRIVAQGFQKSWQPFSELGYYDRIAQEYGDCKSQYRATALKDLVVGAALPGGQRRSRSE